MSDLFSGNDSVLCVFVAMIYFFLKSRLHISTPLRSKIDPEEWNMLLKDNRRK
jgi:hypothetical protein